MNEFAVQLHVLYCSNSAVGRQRSVI